MLCTSHYPSRCLLPANGSKTPLNRAIFLSRYLKSQTLIALINCLHLALLPIGNPFFPELCADAINYKKAQLLSIIPHIQTTLFQAFTSEHQSTMANTRSSTRASSKNAASTPPTEPTSASQLADATSPQETVAPTEHPASTYKAPDVPNDPDYVPSDSESEHSDYSFRSATVAPPVTVSKDVKTEKQRDRILNATYAIETLAPMTKRDSFQFLLVSLQELDLPAMSAAFAPGRVYRTDFNSELNRKTAALLRAKLHPDVRSSFHGGDTYDKFVRHLSKKAFANPVTNLSVGHYDVFNLSIRDGEAPDIYVERVLQSMKRFQSVNRDYGHHRLTDSRWLF